MQPCSSCDLGNHGEAHLQQCSGAQCSRHAKGKEAGWLCGLITNGHAARPPLHCAVSVRQRRGHKVPLLSPGDDTRGGRHVLPLVLRCAGSSADLLERPRARVVHLEPQPPLLPNSCFSSHTGCVKIRFADTTAKTVTQKQGHELLHIAECFFSSHTALDTSKSGSPTQKNTSTPQAMQLRKV